MHRDRPDRWTVDCVGETAGVWSRCAAGPEQRRAPSAIEKSGHARKVSLEEGGRSDVELRELKLQLIGKKRYDVMAERFCWGIESTREEKLRSSAGTVGQASLNELQSSTL